MRILAKIIITATGMASLFSCVKVLDYDIPDDEKRIVVNGILSDAEPFSVHIHKSLHILDRLGIKAIDNALVQLYDGMEIVSEMNQGKNGMYLSRYIPVHGHEYRLQVSVPGMKTAVARCSLPDPVRIIRVDTSLVASEETRYNYAYGVGDTFETDIDITLMEIHTAICFTDPAEAENYYETEIVFRNFKSNLYVFTDTLSDSFISVSQHSYYPTLRSNDPIIDLSVLGNSIMTKDERSEHLYGEKMLFSDQLINGQDYKLMVELSSIDASNITENSTVEIHLKSVTKDYFVYMQLLGKHMQVKDDPLSEPSQAYTNVSDGLGIFGGMSESVYTLNLSHLMIN